MNACVEVYVSVLFSLAWASRDTTCSFCRCKEFYPEGAEGTATSGSHSLIVTEAHTARIKRYIDNTRGTVVFGGQANVEKRWVAPTVICDVSGDDATMQEYVARGPGSSAHHTDIALLFVTLCSAWRGQPQSEIFGPVLPIVPVEDVNEAIAFINARWAAYLSR